MPDFNFILFLDYSILRGFCHIRFLFNTSFLIIALFLYRIQKLHLPVGDRIAKVLFIYCKYYYTILYSIMVK
jgi:hypothetical protein